MILAIRIIRAQKKIHLIIAKIVQTVTVQMKKVVINAFYLKKSQFENWDFLISYFKCKHIISK